MKYRVIENQVTVDKSPYLTNTCKIVLKSLIPSLESRIDDIGAIAKTMMLEDESHYGYSRGYRNPVVEDNLGAFIVKQDCGGYNYNDGGHVSRSGQYIVGVWQNDTEITIVPVQYAFSEKGFVNATEFAGFALDQIDDGILKYRTKLRREFVNVRKHNGAGVVLSQHGTFREGRKKEWVSRELDLNKYFGLDKNKSE